MCGNSSDCMEDDILRTIRAISAHHVDVSKLWGSALEHPARSPLHLHLSCLHIFFYYSCTTQFAFLYSVIYNQLIKLKNTFWFRDYIWYKCIVCVWCVYRGSWICSKTSRFGLPTVSSLVLLSDVIWLASEHCFCFQHVFLFSCVMYTVMLCETWQLLTGVNLFLQLI